jgi:hypothetical protein
VSVARLGWDVGGANVKAALLPGSDHSPPRIQRQSFPLWREHERLPEVLSEMAKRLGGTDLEMAVTMTAELADCFPTKREGVLFVLGAFSSAFPEVRIHVYGIDGRFRSLGASREDPLAVAAANWMATANFVARFVRDAILLDVGSTTTDVVPIVEGRVAALGRTDTERLISGELVYTGALRTPVSAIVRSLRLGGRLSRVTAEHFAIAADAYRWLERIGESGYTAETPDGKGTSRLDAGRRLARMVSSDLETLAEGEVTGIAEQVERAQVRQIATGIRQVRRRWGPEAPSTAFVTGLGSFLAMEAAGSAGLVVDRFSEPVRAAIVEAGPAAAVAWLMREAGVR